MYIYINVTNPIVRRKELLSVHQLPNFHAFMHKFNGVSEYYFTCILNKFEYGIFVHIQKSKYINPYIYIGSVLDALTVNMCIITSTFFIVC